MSNFKESSSSSHFIVFNKELLKKKELYEIVDPSKIDLKTYIKNIALEYGNKNIYPKLQSYDCEVILLRSFLDKLEYVLTEIVLIDEQELENDHQVLQILEQIGLRDSLTYLFEIKNVFIRGIKDCYIHKDHLGLIKNYTNGYEEKALAHFLANPCLNIFIKNTKDEFEEEEENFQIVFPISTT